ncbi:MAG: DUF885 family protein [Gemmatimonadota bacterium]
MTTSAASSAGAVQSAQGLDGYFSRHFARRPIDGTFAGLHAHDDRYPDWSPSGISGLREELAATLAQLRAAGASRSGHVTNAVDARLLDDYCSIQLAELDNRHFVRGNPSLVTGELAFGLISLITRDFAPAGVRARALTGRLNSAPAFLAGAIESLEGAIVPEPWLVRARRELAATSRLLADGLPLWCGSVGLEPRLTDEAASAAASLLGAIRDFDHRLSGLTTTQHPTGCGTELLSLLVGQGHQCHERPQDLREAALEDERLARGRLHALSGGDPRAALSGVAAAAPDPARWFETFSDEWRRCREFVEEHHIVTWPDAPVRFGSIPAWTRSAAPNLYYLYYRSPAPLEPTRTHDYVLPALDGLDAAALVRLLRNWNLSTIRLNHVIHHGGLGHHVQNWHAARASSAVGRIAAVDCASRIAMFCGGTMAEGWACYATDLMDEFGYLSPADQIAEQHSRLRQAVRAIVDLDFHRGLISFDQAVELHVSRALLSPEAAHAEVVRNSMFPGTALMYWLGTRSIHQLRIAWLKHNRGKSLRDFHDTFLSFGSIPVHLIARLMLAR